MSSIILTRYLYPKSRVEVSLIWAILNNQEEEALFWTYELYYSGFRTTVFDLFISIYFLFYNESYPNIHPSMFSLVEKWYKQENEEGKRFLHQDTIPGSLIRILTPLKPNLVALMRYRIGIPYEEIRYEEDTEPVAVEFTLNDLRPYKTIEGFSWKTLREIVKYPIQTIWCDLLLEEENESPNDAIIEYVICILAEKWECPSDIRSHWLYYASKSPIWKNRIDKMGGEIDQDQCTVSFETEDIYEEFCNKYDMELDEQPQSVIEYLYGGSDSLQEMSWEELFERFCESTKTTRIVEIQKSV
jgi:hypothetical protein